MRTRSLHLCGAVVLAVVALVAGAAVAPAYGTTPPVCDPATGHCYEVVRVSGGITWPAAKAAAEARTYEGFRGHLVTITSQAENDFLVTNGLAVAQHWIGGSQPLGQSCANCNWSWVTGEPFTYTNWALFEPNDWYGAASEQYLEFWYPAGRWNDQNNAFREPGYVVEYSRPTTTDQCKNGGWQRYGPFKNQGDCVSFVATSGKNEPGQNVP